MPNSTPPRHAERHGDRDRGERDHGARPLTEHREVEKGAACERAQGACPRSDNRAPRRPRPRRAKAMAAGAASPLSPSAQEPGREDRGRGGERHVEEGAHRARCLPEGEQAEGRVVHQPLHEARDCLVEPEPPLRRNLLEPAGIVRIGGTAKEASPARQTRSTTTAQREALVARCPLVPGGCRRHHCLRGARSALDMTAARSTTPTSVPSASCTAKAVAAGLDLALQSSATLLSRRDARPRCPRRPAGHGR